MPVNFTLVSPRRQYLVRTYHSYNVIDLPRLTSERLLSQYQDLDLILYRLITRSEAVGGHPTRVCAYSSV